MAISHYRVKYQGKIIEIPQVKPDDNVMMFRKKLCYYLDLPENLYIWYEEKVNVNIIREFVKNIFRKKLLIDYNTFEDFTYKVFGKKPGKEFDGKYNKINKTDAFEILDKIKLVKARKSLCFQYMSEGFIVYFPIDPSDETENEYKDINENYYVNNNLASLLSNFNVLNTTFYVHDANKLDSIYKPLDPIKKTVDDKKFINNILELENRIYDITISPSNISEDKTSLNYILIKSDNIHYDKYYNLDTLFDVMQTDTSLSFIKLKTQNNLFYKINKKALEHIDNQTIDKWTKLPSTSESKSHIVLKVLFDINKNVHASIFINEDLSYNIKVAINLKERFTVHYISSFIKNLNKYIDNIKSIFGSDSINNIPDNILNISNGPVRIDRLFCNSSVTFTKLDMKFKEFTNVIKTDMFPFFNIIDSKDKGYMNLQYKKTNNYIKYDNIQTYIHMNKGLDKAALRDNIIINFIVNAEEADKEIEAYYAQHAVEMHNKEKVFLFIKNENIINIRIKLNSNIDFIYSINNLTSIDQLDTVKLLLHKLVYLASNYKGKLTKNIKNIQEQEDKNEQELINYIKKTDSEKSTSDLDSIELESGTNSFVLDDDFLEIQEEFLIDTPPKINVKEAVEEVEKIKKKTKVIDNNDHDDDDPKKNNNYIIQKLYAADPDLFQYEQREGVKAYARTCQWSSRRQPVVVNKNELDNILKKYPDAISGYAKTGSNKNLEDKNYYICPKIFCPKTRVALSFEDYVKNNRKCPDSDETPLLFNDTYYHRKQGSDPDNDMALKTDRYPTFLAKGTHPQRHCIPCCYKKLSVKECEDKYYDKNGNRIDKGKEKKVDIVDDEQQQQQPEQDQEYMKKEKETAHERYIKGQDFYPLEAKRFGLLPDKLISFFNQSKTQGSRHDGTGNINEKTNAFFRYGVNQSNQSFINSIESILGYDNLIEYIINNIDVLYFLKMENGRILKIFIDDSQNIFNVDVFKDFKEWFITQKKYITQMSLQRLIPVLDESKGDFKNIKDNYEIIREFVVYNAFINFKKYLQDPNVIKDHIILYSLIVQPFINKNKYNIVVIEYSHNNELNIYCGINSDIKPDINYPFVFIFKRNQYYERIVHIELENNKVIMTSAFEYSNKKLKKMINFLNNCTDKYNQKLSEFINYLKANGQKLKYYVIDYGYKICGLILNKNLYIPFIDQRYDFHYEPHAKYIYISDVPTFVCTRDQSDIEEVFNQIVKFTKNQGYKVVKIDKTGVVLNNSIYFIPRDMSKLDNTNKIRVSFINSLYILTKFEALDKRSELYNAIVKENELYKMIYKELKDNIPDDKFNFLLDKYNPLPMVYKRKKLMDMMQKNSIKEKISFKLFDFLMTYDSKIKYSYLSKTKKNYYPDTEFLFDYYDVLNGKLATAINFQKQPYKALINRIEELEKSLVFNEIPTDSFSDVFTSGNLVSVPIVWKSILQHYNILSIELYNNRILIDTFMRISRVIDHEFTEELYHLTIKNNIIRDFNNSNLDEFLSNPVLSKFKASSLENIFKKIDDLNYFPSTYEIKIMAKLCGINLVIIGRKTKGVENLYFSNNYSDYIVIINQAYDRVNNRNVFSFIVKDQSLFHKMSDTNVAFIEKIKNKEFKGVSDFHKS